MFYELYSTLKVITEWKYSQMFPQRLTPSTPVEVITFLGNAVWKIEELSLINP